MKLEFKKLFTTKKGILIFITILYSMVMPYLTILTLKYPSFANGCIDYGTLCLSFIPMLFGDLLAECYGWKKSVVIATVAYTIQLLFTIVLHLTTLNGNCIGFGDIESIATSAYNLLFGAQWRIMISGAIGYYVGIFMNSFIMGIMKAKVKDNDNSRWFFFRCIFSTIIGQLLDNGLFFILAMSPVGIDSSSELPWNLLFINIGITSLLEVGYEVLLFPLTKLLTKKINGLEYENTNI